MKRLLFITLALTTTLLIPASAKAEIILPHSEIKPTFTLEIIKPEIKLPDHKPNVYEVKAGDNLSKIGQQHNVEWQRLWAKNTDLKHPDLLYVGTKLTIPAPSEQLKRDLPVVVALPKETPNVEPLRSFDGDNTYEYGYCTWFVKNKRGASLPNGLGNANTWYARAPSYGLSVGSIPKPGAVGTTTRGKYGHVVYVESVNANGSINISEMNYKAWGVATARTASASEFVYIY